MIPRLFANSVALHAPIAVTSSVVLSTVVSTLISFNCTTITPLSKRFSLKQTKFSKTSEISPNASQSISRTLPHSPLSQSFRNQTTLRYLEYQKLEQILIHARLFTYLFSPPIKPILTRFHRIFLGPEELTALISPQNIPFSLVISTVIVVASMLTGLIPVLTILFFCPT